MEPHLALAILLPARGRQRALFDPLAGACGDAEELKEHSDDRIGSKSTTRPARR